MPSTTILEEIEAEKTAQQRLRHLSSVSSLPSADLAFIDGFWERHLADMPGRDGYPEGCLLLLDDVRAVLSGSVGAILVIAPHTLLMHITDFTTASRSSTRITPSSLTGRRRPLKNAICGSSFPSKLWRHMEEHRI